MRKLLVVTLLALASCAGPHYWIRDDATREEARQVMADAKLTALEHSPGWPSDRYNEILAAYMHAKGYRLVSAEEAAALGKTPDAQPR